MAKLIWKTELNTKIMKKIKVIYGAEKLKFEEEVNLFLKTVKGEVEDIKFTTDFNVDNAGETDSYFNAFIIYKPL